MKTSLRHTLLKENACDRLLLRSDAAGSVFVVFLGFLFGTILVWAIGKNPVNIYKALLQSLTGIQIKNGNVSFNIRYVGEWLTKSMPLILCGLSMGFAAKTGLFNIGAEGQYMMGITAAQIMAIFGPQVTVLHWLIAIIFATFAGAIWGGIVGLLKAKFEVSEVVATIMLNYIALYLSRIIIMAIPGTNTYKTVNYPATALLGSDFLIKITNNSQLNLGIIFVVISLFVYWFIIEKTKTGYELRATGFNKEAALCSGISVVRSIFLSMAIAGAFAGLAGGIVALGSFKYGRVPTMMDGYGFTGIAVALVGNNSAFGTLFAGLLFGLLASSQPLMQSLQIPKEITFIIQGLIVIFIALRSGVKIFIQWKIKKGQ